MEDVENIKWFSDWMADLIFFFAHLQRVLTKRKKYEEITNAKPFIIPVFLEWKIF